jgi:hypothetical protein
MIRIGKGKRQKRDFKANEASKAQGVINAHPSLIISLPSQLFFLEPNPNEYKCKSEKTKGFLSQSGWKNRDDIF